MTFLNYIVSGLQLVASWFYNAFQTVNGWIYPFNNLASPLYQLYSVFSTIATNFGYFRQWAISAEYRLSNVFSLSQVIDYFQSWMQKAATAYSWVVNAYSNISSAVTSWWNTKQYEVQVWIDQAKQWALAQIENLAGALSDVQTWWNSFKDKIPSLDAILLWFSNWWSNILSNLNSWWIERLLDIESLFNSWIIELSPLWAGWQEIRETIFTFFNDPLGQLEAKFTNWFLGEE